MALASHAHVGGPIEHEFARPARHPCGHRGETGNCVGVVFLAAKTTTETFHVDLDGVQRHAERARHAFLDNGRALCR